MMSSYLSILVKTVVSACFFPRCLQRALTATRSRHFRAGHSTFRKAHDSGWARRQRCLLDGSHPGADANAFGFNQDVSIH